MIHNAGTYGGEAFARHNESLAGRKFMHEQKIHIQTPTFQGPTYRGIRSKVEKDLSNGIEYNKEGSRCVEDWLIRKTEDDKHDSEHNKTHDLDEFSAQAINGEDGDPVTRDRTEQLDDQVTDASLEDRTVMKALMLIP
jgi:hypothetical protein